jgi:hypothetical protein
MKTLIFSLILLSGASVLATQAFSDERPQSQTSVPGTNTLSPEQRWNALSESEKNQIRENYKSWKNLPEERKTELRSRFRRFQSMSPEMKERIRTRYQRFKALPLERQNQLRERFREFKKTPCRGAPKAPSVDARAKNTEATGSA